LGWAKNVQKNPKKVVDSPLHLWDSLVTHGNIQIQNNMRTKTLLLTAALSAAGLATSLAQSNVYSLNIVGYVNRVYDPGFHMINNPLVNSNNTVAQLFPNPPFLTTIYKFTAGAFQPANTFLGAWGDPNQVLAPGEGAFINFPAGPNITNTYVGEVRTGNLTNTLIPGFNMVGSQVPQAGLLQADLGLVPGFLDSVYQFNNHVYAPANTYLGSWGGGDPSIAVGEAFWFNNAQPANNNWSRSFTVQ